MNTQQEIAARIARWAPASRLDTEGRAKRAAHLIRLASQHSCWETDTHPLRSRQFDDCFENGDGQNVLRLLAIQIRRDPQLECAFYSSGVQNVLGRAWVDALWRRGESAPDETLSLF